MATAIYEKRNFTNKVTGEIIPYEVYAIVAIVDGERMELPLKNLNASEKIAFKIIAAGESPTIEELTVVSSKSKDGESPTIVRKSDPDFNLFDDED